MVYYNPHMTWVGFHPLKIPSPSRGPLFSLSSCHPTVERPLIPQNQGSERRIQEPTQGLLKNIHDGFSDPLKMGPTHKPL